MLCSKEEQRNNAITSVVGEVKRSLFLTLTDLENKLVVTKGVGGGSGMDRDFGVSRYKLLHLEWISNEVLLYNTGNHIQSFLIGYDRR